MDYSLTEEQEYPLSLFNKIFYSLLASGILFFDVYMSGVHWKHPADVWIVLPLMTIPALLLLISLRRKVIINGNSILNVGLFTTKELPLQAVKGRRLPSKAIVLEPLSTEYPRIMIGNYSDLSKSEQLLEWVTANFTDLDAADLVTAREELLQDDAPGTIPRRQQLLNRARTIVPIYNTVAGIAAFILIFLTGTSFSVLTLLLPLVGIFLLFTHRGMIKFYSVSNRSIYPAVFYGITFSSVFPLMRSIFQYNLLHPFGLCLPAFIVAMVFALFLYRKGINPTAGALNAQMILIVIVSLAYGFGSTRLLNCKFDHSRATTYPAIVQERFISTSKGRSYYYFGLAPWGPDHTSGQVEAGRLLYRETHVGDTVTVKLKQGLLGAPWYWVKK